VQAPEVVLSKFTSLLNCCREVLLCTHDVRGLLGVRLLCLRMLTDIFLLLCEKDNAHADHKKDFIKLFTDVAAQQLQQPPSSCDTTQELITVGMAAARELAWIINRVYLYSLGENMLHTCWQGVYNYVAALTIRCTDHFGADDVQYIAYVAYLLKFLHDGMLDAAVLSPRPRTPTTVIELVPSLLKLTSEALRAATSQPAFVHAVHRRNLAALISSTVGLCWENHSPIVSQFLGDHPRIFAELRLAMMDFVIPALLSLLDSHADEVSAQESLEESIREVFVFTTKFSVPCTEKNHTWVVVMKRGEEGTKPCAPLFHASPSRAAVSALDRNFLSATFHRLCTFLQKRGHSAKIELLCAEFAALITIVSNHRQRTEAMRRLCNHLTQNVRQTVVNMFPPYLRF
jgi:hypothetical protein